jgi:hypothetical protein
MEALSAQNSTVIEYPAGTIQETKKAARKFLATRISLHPCSMDARFRDDDINPTPKRDLKSRKNHIRANIYINRSLQNAPDRAKEAAAHPCL